MGLFNIKNLQKAAQDAMNTVSEVAQEAVSTVSEAAQGVAQNAVKAAEDHKMPEFINSTLSGGEADAQSEKLPPEGVCIEDALSLFYYLMSADGSLEQGELDAFESICGELDKSGRVEKSSIMKECEKQLTAHTSRISPLFTAMACIDAVLYSQGTSIGDGAEVPAKLLIWDMLAIAYGDESFDDSERELITHVAQYFGVSERIVVQMEDCMLALTDLEREQNWVKTTTRPYLTIEAIVNETDKRKSAIFEGVQALITL